MSSLPLFTSTLFMSASVTVYPLGHEVPPCKKRIVCLPFRASEAIMVRLRRFLYFESALKDPEKSYALELENTMVASASLQFVINRFPLQTPLPSASPSPPIVRVTPAGMESTVLNTAQEPVPFRSIAPSTVKEEFAVERIPLDSGENTTLPFTRKAPGLSEYPSDMLMPSHPPEPFLLELIFQFPPISTSDFSHSFMPALCCIFVAEADNPRLKFQSP